MLKKFPWVSLSLKCCLVVVLGTLVGVVDTSPAYADAKPSISLSEASYDFGAVPQGATIVHEFEVKNSGTADLVIQRLSPSCGCTATTMTSPTVKPGSSEKVRLSFDTSGFFGKKTKTVQIVTNDAADPEKIFTLTGTVVSGYSVEPSKLDFGDISPSSSLATRQKEVVLSIEEGSTLKITKVSSLSNSLLVSPVVTQGNKASVKVEILPNAPKGDFRDRIIFEIEGGRRAAINVPVMAVVKGDLRVSPSTISFGVVSGSEILERRVQFENSGSEPVAFTSIKSSDPAVTGSFVAVQPGRQGVIVIKLDPQLAKGDIKTTVDLATNHPTERTISLNVFAVQPAR